jgi:hypothetical protein
MKITGFWKNLLTFGLYTLFAKYKKKNPENDYTLIVDTLLETRAGVPVTRDQMLAALSVEMDGKGLTLAERELAIALLKKKLDKAGVR